MKSFFLSYAQNRAFSIDVMRQSEGTFYSSSNCRYTQGRYSSSKPAFESNGTQLVYEKNLRSLIQEAKNGSYIALRTDDAYIKSQSLSRERS